MIKSIIVFLGTSSSFRQFRIFPETFYGNSFLYILLYGRIQSTVFGSQGIKKTKLEIPYKIYDVVSAS